MKKIIALFSIVLLILSLSFSSFAIDFPQPTSKLFVNDFANVIGEEDEEEIMKIGADLYTQTSAQVVVVTVDTLDGYDEKEYALELGREWGVGSKETNNGVVLLLSVSERRVTIQSGYGLEGCVTDAKSGQILDEYVVPYLKENDFSTGLTEGYKAVVSVVCNEYGVELDPNYEINYYDTYEADDDFAEDVLGGLIIVFVIIVIFVLVAGKFSGGGSNHSGGSYHGGGRTYHRPTHYGGFSGGSRGGFSGGGFRGGGGSFGGGGASRGF